MKKTIKLSSLGHTWIFDLDGTICKHNGYKVDREDTLLPGVKEFFANLPRGDKVIILTSRLKKYKEITIKFLKDNNIYYSDIIFDCPYGERILVNDKKPSGLKCGASINLIRNEGLKFKYKIDKKI